MRFWRRLGVRHWLWIGILFMGLNSVLRVAPAAWAVNMSACEIMKSWPPDLHWIGYAAGQSITSNNREGLRVVAERLMILASLHQHSYIEFFASIVFGQPGKSPDAASMAMQRPELVRQIIAMAHIRAGDDAAGLDGLRTSDSGATLHALGRRLRLQGELDRAARFLMAARDQGYGPSKTELARVYQDQIAIIRTELDAGHYERAREGLTDIMRVVADPFTMALARLEWGRAVNDPIIAEQTWLAVLGESDDLVIQQRTLEYLINQYLRQARFCEAAALAERGLNLLPDAGTFYYYLGRAYEGLGAWSLAGDSYSAALLRAPDYEPYQRRLNQIRSQQAIDLGSEPEVVCGP